MVRYRFETVDALDVRFVVSPLSEAAMSLRTLKEPRRFVLQRPWVTATQSALRRVDMDLLLALPNDDNHWPDFLQPITGQQEPTIDAELDAVRSTSRDAIDRDFRAIHGVVPTRFTSDNAACAIADALAVYWAECVVPHWHRMKVVLDADVVHRANRLVHTGLQRTLSGLSSTIRVDAGTIEIQSRHGIDDERAIPRGGITLRPTLFSDRAAFPASADSPLMISYGARGQAHMWSRRPPVDPDAVAVLLGTSRTRILRLLEEPRSSTDVAGALGVTVSAANQHLRLMQAAGLLTAARHGRYVLYQRSSTGDALVI